jgi:Domain of unknown function (DUF4157)
MAHDDHAGRRASIADLAAPDPVVSAPGRATLTARLAPRLVPEVQRRVAADEPAAPRATAIGADASWHALFEVLAPAASDHDTTRTVASRGVAGAGSELPHRAQLQASFGRHAPALDDVRAHVGGDAATASRAIGADAYATGTSIAFAAPPDLHLAAHEAAHVVQQRAGVALSGGVGAAGDPYEQHADRVADAVVRGVSAEAILDEHAGTGGGAHVAVQRFEEGEHAAIGGAASGNRIVPLADDFALPFGFVTMLAGDHFGSLDELEAVAARPPKSKRASKSKTAAPQGDAAEAAPVDTREQIEYLIVDNHLFRELERIYDDFRKHSRGSPLVRSLRNAVEETQDRYPDDFDPVQVRALTTKYKQLALSNYAHFDRPFDGSDGKAGPITMEEQAIVGAGESVAGQPNPSGAIARWVDLAPLTAPRAYRMYHLQAIESAVAAGNRGGSVNDAILREAFGSHFLSDAFAAGHARTARFDIQKSWNAKVPMFPINLRGYLAQLMSEELAGPLSQARVYEGTHPGRTGIGVVDDVTTHDGAFDQISDALSDIKGFGFGDLVSAVVHDYDNANGVWADVGGKTVELFGDGHLGEGSEKKLAIRAVKRGIADIDRAFALAKGGMGFDEVVGELVAGDGFFAPERLIPTALPDYDEGEQSSQAAPRWDFSTLDMLLADTTFQAGLAITMSEKKSQFENAIADKSADIRAAFKKRVLARLDDAAGALQFLRGVIDWAPHLQEDGPPRDPVRYSTDLALDYVRQARAIEGGLDSLTPAARATLLEVLGQDTSSESAAAQQEILAGASQDDRASLVAGADGSGGGGTEGMKVPIGPSPRQR